MLDIDKTIAELEAEINELLSEETELVKEAAGKKEKRARKETELKLYASFRELLSKQEERHKAEIDDLRQAQSTENSELREGLHTVRVKLLNGSGVTVNEIDDIAITAGIDLTEDIEPGPDLTAN